MSEAKARQVRAQREGTVEVEPGITLRYRRPTDGHMQVMRNLSPDAVCGLVIGWTGVTDAFLFGAAVGSSDELEFSPELALEVVGDRSAWLLKVAQAVAEAVRLHFELRNEVTKN